MFIDLINRDISPTWFVSNDLCCGGIYVTKQTNKVCVVIELNGDYYILFLDDLEEVYKIPYWDANERFAELCDVKLTVEYNFNIMQRTIK